MTHHQTPRIATTLFLACALMLTACERRQNERRIELQKQFENHYAKATEALQQSHIQTATAHADSTLLICQKANDSILLVQACTLRSDILLAQGKLQDAILLLNQAWEIAWRQRDGANTALVDLKISTIKQSSGKQHEAVAHTRKAYNYALSANDSTLITLCLIELGHNYLQVDDLEQARTHFKRAEQHIPQEEMSLRAYKLALGLGILYENTENINIATQQFQKALRIARKIKHRPYEADALLSAAHILAKRGNADSADLLISEAEKIIDRNPIALAKLYYTRGFVDAKKGKLNHTTTAYETALQISKNLGDKILENHLYRKLAETEKQKNNLEEAYLYQRKAVATQDSLNERIVLRRFITADLEAKYQQEKTQQIIQETLAKNERKRGRIQRIVMAIALLWTAVGLWFAHRTFGERIAKNQQLKKEQEDIETRKEELKTTSERITQLQEESLTLNKKLQKSRRELKEYSVPLIQSIEYANTLQQTILPTKQNVQKHFPESFLLSRPKDIISADLPYFAHIDNTSILALIDCSGHSIAGTALTFITYMHLNSIIVEQRETKPNEIIKKFHQQIDESLASSERSFRQNININISVLTVNREANLALFAANGQVLFHSENRETISRIRCKPMQHNTRNTLLPSQNIEIPLSQYATFYLTTDGYISQMNADRIKFGSSKFIETLRNIQHLPLKKQKTELLRQHAKHKLGAPQMDDITIFAVAITPQNEENQG